MTCKQEQIDVLLKPEHLSSYTLTVIVTVRAMVLKYEKVQEGQRNKICTNIPAKGCRWKHGQALTFCLLPEQFSPTNTALKQAQAVLQNTILCWYTKELQLLLAAFEIQTFTHISFKTHGGTGPSVEIRDGTKFRITDAL